MPSVNFATAFTYLNPVECDICLPPKLVISLVDIPIIGLTGAGYWDFREFGGIPADKSSNSNQSDVNLVVPGAADSGNMYTVIAEFQKIY